MFDFNIARLFADAVFAKIKNPMRQLTKVPRSANYRPHQGVGEVARRARQIQNGQLQTN